MSRRPDHQMIRLVTLLADAATGRFEAIHLGVALGADAAVSSLSKLLLARAVVESGVGIDPNLDARVSLKMNHGRGSFGDSEGDERPLPGPERRALWRTGRRPQQRQQRH